MADAQDFTGMWVVTHWYPTQDDSGEHDTSYRMQAHQKGDALIFESEPDKDGAYMIIHLNVDGRVATGTWHENTNPKGTYEGMQYSGAGQLIISDDGRTLEGLWAGAGVDHKLNQPRIYTGRWRFERA